MDHPSKTHPARLPRHEDLPLEVHMLKLSVQELVAERKDVRRTMRAVWMTLLGLAVTVLLAGAAGLLQMGAYMERIDSVRASQERLEQVMYERGER